MKLKYHAWLRDSMGRDSDIVVLPPEIGTVGQLIDWLPTQDERFVDAFEFIDTILISVNSQYAGRDHPITNEDEVLFAPPIAGG